jgi:hypothetical protein
MPGRYLIRRGWSRFSLPSRVGLATLGRTPAGTGRRPLDQQISRSQVDLHHLLLAGLPAHFESSHPNQPASQCGLTYLISGCENCRHSRGNAGAPESLGPESRSIAPPLALITPPPKLATSCALRPDSLDWAPQVPFTIEVVNDINTPNLLSPLINPQLATRRSSISATPGTSRSPWSAGTPERTS